jgi:hypothetical protein
MFPVHEASSQVSLMSPMLQQVLLLCPVKSGCQALQLLSCTVGEGGYVGGGLGTGEGGGGGGIGDGGGGDLDTIAELRAAPADGAGGSGEGGLSGARDTPQTS